MELAVSARPYPLPFPSFFSSNLPNPFLTKPFPSPPKPNQKRLKHKSLVFRASASGNPNGSDAFSWPFVARSIRRGSERALSNLSESLKRATGLDLEHANRNISGLVDRFWDAIRKEEPAFNRFRFELFPAFVDWNRLEGWKDLKKWEPKRIGALILYLFILFSSCQRIYVVYRGIRLHQSKKELNDVFMEALIPEPTPTNIRNLPQSGSFARDRLTEYEEISTAALFSVELRWEWC